MAAEFPAARRAARAARRQEEGEEEDAAAETLAPLHGLSIFVAPNGDGEQRDTLRARRRRRRKGRGDPPWCRHVRRHAPRARRRLAPRPRRARRRAGVAVRSVAALRPCPVEGFRRRESEKFYRKTNRLRASPTTRPSNRWRAATCSWRPPRPPPPPPPSRLPAAASARRGLEPLRAVGCGRSGSSWKVRAASSRRRRVVVAAAAAASTSNLTGGATAAAAAAGGAAAAAAPHLGYSVEVARSPGGTSRTQREPSRRGAPHGSPYVGGGGGGAARRATGAAAGGGGGGGGWVVGVAERFGRRPLPARVRVLKVLVPGLCTLSNSSSSWSSSSSSLSSPSAAADAGGSSVKACGWHALRAAQPRRRHRRARRRRRRGGARRGAGRRESPRASRRRARAKQCARRARRRATRRAPACAASLATRGRTHCAPRLTHLAARRPAPPALRRAARPKR